MHTLVHGILTDSPHVERSVTHCVRANHDTDIAVCHLSAPVGAFPPVAVNSEVCGHPSPFPYLAHWTPPFSILGLDFVPTRNEYVSRSPLCGERTHQRPMLSVLQKKGVGLVACSHATILHATRGWQLPTCTRTLTRKKLHARTRGPQS